MKEILLSVIIPNYNSLFIDKTLNSLEKQVLSRNDVEIIVVGVDKYNLVKGFDFVKFIDTKVKKKPSYSRNMGVKKAKGKYILFIDADVLADSKLVANTLISLKRNLIVGGAVDYPKNDYFTLCDNIMSFYAYHPSNGVRGLEQVCSINMALDRKIFEDVNGFDEELFPGEDLDLSMRLRLRGYKLYFDPALLVYHYPNRKNFNSLIEHVKSWATSGFPLRLKYSEILGTSRIINPNMLRFGSIFLSFFMLIKIFKNRKLMPYLYTAPVIFLLRNLWCFYAAEAIENVK